MLHALGRMHREPAYLTCVNVHSMYVHREGHLNTRTHKCIYIYICVLYIYIYTLNTYIYIYVTHTYIYYKYTCYIYIYTVYGYYIHYNPSGSTHPLNIAAHPTVDAARRVGNPSSEGQVPIRPSTDLGVCKWQK